MHGLLVEYDCSSAIFLVNSNIILAYDAYQPRPHSVFILVQTMSTFDL